MFFVAGELQISVTDGNLAFECKLALWEEVNKGDCEAESLGGAIERVYGPADIFLDIDFYFFKYFRNLVDLLVSLNENLVDFELQLFQARPNPL